jgi:hypothetical protein
VAGQFCATLDVVVRMDLDLHSWVLRGKEASNARTISIL